MNDVIGWVAAIAILLGTDLLSRPARRRFAVLLFAVGNLLISLQALLMWNRSLLAMGAILSAMNLRTYLKWGNPK